MGEAIGATSKQRHNLALVHALSGNQQKAQEVFGKDMEAGEVNENIHALNMVQKPNIPPKGMSELSAQGEGEEAR